MALPSFSWLATQGLCRGRQECSQGRPLEGRTIMTPRNGPSLLPEVCLSNHEYCVWGVDAAPHSAYRGVELLSITCHSGGLVLQYYPFVWSGKGSDWLNITSCPYLPDFLFNK